MVCVLGVGHGSPPDDDSFCGYYGKEDEEYGGWVRNVYTPCVIMPCVEYYYRLSRGKTELKEDRIEVSLSLESFRPAPNHELKPLSVPSTERSTMTHSKVSGRFKHPPPTQSQLQSTQPTTDTECSTGRRGLPRFRFRFRRPPFLPLK